MATLRDTITTKRIEAGLTQQELADKIGTRQVCISRWESGVRRPNIGSLIKLAQALKCSASELIDCL